MDKKWFMVLTLIVLLAFLSTTTYAMSSPNYRLDWFVPLIGSGGMASSTNYTVTFTVGQSAIGTLSSSSYQTCLGFWCSEAFYRLFLPLILRSG